MGDEGLPNGNGSFNVRENGGALDKETNSEFRPGDLTWIKLRGASWWPAQIVDENLVGDILKPRKGKRGDVLVRLYGTYKHSYMNPVTSLLEFDDVLKQSKCSQREYFMKELEQDLAKLQSRRTKASKAKTKGNGCADLEKTTPLKRATEEQDMMKKKCKLGYDDVPEKSEVSARRLKVMQGLGLTAPSGSPF